LFQKKNRRRNTTRKSLESRATGEEIFNEINSYMTEHEIRREKRALMEKSNDRTSAMDGGASSHRVLHRQALVA
jgi:hypothetical protein